MNSLTLTYKPTPIKAVAKPYNKNDLEMELNDTPIDKLPAHFKAIIANAKGSNKPTKFGRKLRDDHRDLFDAYFSQLAESRKTI